MNHDQIAQQIMFHSFVDELEKVAAARGLDLAPLSLHDFMEMQKEAGWMSNLTKSVGKKGRAAAVGIGLMGPMATKQVSDVGSKRVSSFVQSASKAAPSPTFKAKMKKPTPSSSGITPLREQAPGDMTHGYMSYDQAMKSTGGNSRKAIDMTRGTSGGKIWRD